MLSTNDTTDQLTVKNYFYGETNSYTASWLSTKELNPYKIEKIKFADGTVWNYEDLTSETINGTGGADSLYGYDGKDQLNGLDGNDDLHGGTGDDVLDGGAGNDTLDGGVGNDTYVFSRGFGQDVISDNDPPQGNMDTVTFGPDITPADVHVTHDTQNLYLTIDGSMDQVKLSNWLTSDAYKIEQVKFSNGTVWNRTTLLAKAMEPGDGADRLFGDGEDNVLSGLGGDDTLFGQDGNDTLMGGTDNDTLDGGTGADTLDGGAGVDTMNGGAGSDTYVFNRGYGRDTVSDWDASGSDIDVVQFGPDIAPNDVRITRDAYHLYLQVNGTSDGLTLSNYFSGPVYRIDQVKFADGTLWTDLESRVTSADPTSNADTVYGSLRDDAIDGLEGNDTLYGKEGNDTLSGGDGADVLFGGAGDDTLDGGAGNDALNGGESYYGYGMSNGNDTYLFGRGSGQDAILDNDVAAGNRDTVQMASDVLPSDVRVTRDYQNLYLSINVTTDKLTLQSWFVNDAHKVEQVRFPDGTLWDLSTLLEKSRISSEVDNTLIGNGSDDVINGLGGNDLLDGQGGNDILDGGAGDDTLVGGTGADTYRFGRGYGQDVITEVYETTAGVVDTVQLAADIAPADITVTKYGYDLHLNIADTSDRLTLRNWLNGTNYRVEEVRFADGTVWNGATLETLAAQAGIVGTAGNDSLIGTSGDDSIQGAGGNDIVYGYGGRDVLDGGSGNDTLYAASSAGVLDSGDDVYLFGRGSGRDTVYDYDTTAGNTDVIRLTADVLPSDVVVWRGTNDLYLSIGAVTGSEDRITISNWFANTANRIERIEFADGTVWGTAVLTTAPVLGTTGNDTLYGTVGDDLFDGGAGNDMLYGYTSGGYDSGDDVYLLRSRFGSGHGV